MSTPKEAFERVHKHLSDDVGTFLALVQESRTSGAKSDFMPHWALLRMMFPVAESLADLIYQIPNQTAQNLKSVLEKQFIAVRERYRGKSAILTQLFRHSLTHSDEPRTLMLGQKRIGWLVSYDARPEHLKVIRSSLNEICIRFDSTAFYDDLVSVCLRAMNEETDPRIVTQYNSWLELTLDPCKTSHKAAIDEICKLFASPT